MRGVNGTRKPQPTSTIERLRIAGAIAPTLRALNRPIRTINLVDAHGKVTGRTNSHDAAKSLLLRQGIEFDVVVPLIKVCAECGGQFLPVNPRARYCGKRCQRRHMMRKHRARHQGASRAKARSRYQRNREKARARKRDYDARISAAGRKPARNIEKERERAKRYRARNLAKVRERDREFQRAKRARKK